MLGGPDQGVPYESILGVDPWPTNFRVNGDGKLAVNNTAFNHYIAGVTIEGLIEHATSIDLRIDDTEVGLYVEPLISLEVLSQWVGP